jgi:asparaginyl-tRNA synthetase
MFKVTALPFDGTPRTEDGKVNYKISWRNKHGFWTTGRRNFAMALGQIYTFGPTFRADSNTSRHLAFLDD